MIIISITYTYEHIKKTLETYGLFLRILPEDYHKASLSKLFVEDQYGFKYVVAYNSIVRNKHGILYKGRVHKGNPFAINNINNYLKLWGSPFICISNNYINNNQDLEFRCLRCGKIIVKTWRNVRNPLTGGNRRPISCDNCDKRYESLHASVLKQVFIHEYPDTIVEDRSFRSQSTDKIRPTDIVNHRLKIAIEIQSQWHDFRDARLKDDEKRVFWESLGYQFFTPDIRDYTVLEMCQLFFDLNEIPLYVNQNYGSCVNAKVVQELLNAGLDITSICNTTGYTRHQIYDAKKTGKINYPRYYHNRHLCPIEQYSAEWEYIATYPSIKVAAESVGTNPKNISSQLAHNRTYCAGYNWKRKCSVL